jgi:hypothetical protein
MPHSLEHDLLPLASAVGSAITRIAGRMIIEEEAAAAARKEEGVAAVSQAATAVAAVIEAAATTGDRNAGVAEANLQAAKRGRR